MDHGQSEKALKTLIVICELNQQTNRTPTDFRPERQAKNT